MTKEEKWMKRALAEAKKAQKKDEVPIGAIIVKEDTLLATGYNCKEHKKLPTAHAEIIAIERACKHLGDWRLDGCDMYVTLEPCFMCVGACKNARLRTVYFGAYEKKSMQSVSATTLATQNALNDNTTFVGGVLSEPCAHILSSYFVEKRQDVVPTIHTNTTNITKEISKEG